MPTTVPAMTGKFGSTNYYITTMKAAELAEKLKIPKELTEWEDLTIEQRFQREIDYNRVKKHIATYLVNDPDRFFGALIVDMYNAEGIEFEPLGSINDKIPKYYKSAATSFGFLHMTGSEILVPLDGQHRLAAFKFAITGKDEKNKDIDGITPSMDVAKDDVTVILVAHDDQKARKIFNKVNRYAKSTSKAENLITADDDIIAVITRDIANDLIGQRLINFESNTLNKQSECFTTLSALYDSNHKILEHKFGKIDTTVLPDSAKRTLYKKEIQDVWEALITYIKLFSLALADKNPSGDDKRREIRKNYLLGKPIAQFALVMAFLRIRELTNENGAILKEAEIIDRLNALNWEVSNPDWQNVLMSGDKVVSGRTAALLASRFIAYMAGEKLISQELQALEDNYKALFPLQQRATTNLPRPLYPNSVKP